MKKQGESSKDLADIVLCHDHSCCFMSVRLPVSFNFASNFCKYSVHIWYMYAYSLGQAYLDNISVDNIVILTVWARIIRVFTYGLIVFVCFTVTRFKFLWPFPPDTNNKKTRSFQTEISVENDDNKLTCDGHHEEAVTQKKRLSSETSSGEILSAAAEQHETCSRHVGRSTGSPCTDSADLGPDTNVSTLNNSICRSNSENKTDSEYTPGSPRAKRLRMDKTDFSVKISPTSVNDMKRNNNMTNCGSQERSKQKTGDAVKSERSSSEVNALADDLSLDVEDSQHLKCAGHTKSSGAVPEVTSVSNDNSDGNDSDVDVKRSKAAETNTYFINISTHGLYFLSCFLPNHTTQIYTS